MVCCNCSLNYCGYVCHSERMRGISASFIGWNFSVLLHLRMTRLFRNRWGEKKENEVNLDLSTECEESYRLVGDSSRRSHSAWHAHGMRFFLLAVVRMTYVLFRMDMRNLYICHLERKWEISSLGIFRGYVLNRVVILDRWFFTSLILRSAWHAFQGR